YPCEVKSSNRIGAFCQLGYGQGHMGRSGRSHWYCSHVLQVHRKGEWGWVGFGRKNRLGGAMGIGKRKIFIFKPKNFSNDFLLTTLIYMFEKPDVQAQVWKNQRTIHERSYPQTRFTLDQMLNNVRLEVKEESEVSLELLSFVRQQQQEGFRPE
nr:hypothetical protein [Tanacetum cinerariifolium]